MDSAEPVDTALVKAWAKWALRFRSAAFWSRFSSNPELPGGIPWFTFGRLRSVHVGGVLFGSFTTAFIALL